MQGAERLHGSSSHPRRQLPNLLPDRRWTAGGPRHHNKHTGRRLRYPPTSPEQLGSFKFFPQFAGFRRGGKRWDMGQRMLTKQAGCHRHDVFSLTEYAGRDVAGAIVVGAGDESVANEYVLLSKDDVAARLDLGQRLRPRFGWWRRLPGRIPAQDHPCLAEWTSSDAQLRIPTRARLHRG